MSTNVVKLEVAKESMITHSTRQVPIEHIRAHRPDHWTAEREHRYQDFNLPVPAHVKHLLLGIKEFRALLEAEYSQSKKSWI